jgi:hypothetical protein
MPADDTVLCQSCVVFHERLFQFTDQDGHYLFVVYRNSFVMITSTQKQYCVPGIRSVMLI